MLKLKNAAIVLTLAIGLSNISYSQNGGVEHMDALSASFKELKKDTWQYLKAITRGKNARKLESKREQLIQQYKDQSAAVKLVPAYNGDSSLKVATIKYLDLNQTVLKRDYEKIVDMEAVAEESYDLMEAYILANKKANKVLSDAFNELQAVQNNFADNNNITLIEGEQDKKSEKIERASEMLNYYNTVYLVFFKVYKQEAYVLAAQETDDITAFEQNINALSIEADEALAKLDTMKGFKGDKSIIAGARKMINYYKIEADKEFPKVSDFNIKKDNFEKAKQIMDSKKKKERTKEDVDKYNQAVNEYNEAANSINETNENLNKYRSERLNNWNKAVESFFKAHN